MSLIDNASLVEVFYLVAAICFILALKGLSSPRTARRGNQIGAAGAAIALLTALLSEDLDHLPLILIAIVVGAAVAVPAAYRVQMTQMPQLVALFNGVGGGAAALVAMLELTDISWWQSGRRDLWIFGNNGFFLYGDNVDKGIAEFVKAIVADGANGRAVEAAAAASPGNTAAIAFTVLVGAVSFAGSVITFLKLQELMTTRPVVVRNARELLIGGLALSLVLAVAVFLTGRLWLGLLLLLVGLALGVMLVLPVGGADVPIVISLLNAFTGLTVAAGGFVLHNTLLLVAGTLVGASGTILTRAMASAMGRSVAGVMFGALKGGSTVGSTAVSDRPVKSVQPDDVAILLGYAQKVVVVPGYGLAVAQAQHTIRELAEVLEAKGIDVAYGIHPVAGRMPGHMNVLLAEANVPYEALKEMDEVNPEFKTTDVVLVVGANDVVNPAAKTTPSAPIYGMPILEVADAQQVIFLKRSMRPGFAGIENELLYDPKTSLLFGDAKDSLTKVLGAVKAL
ncbi:MAG: NAD(P)(+) transhydrogenase (Re/Si-specific) subunit beta [Kineosporiaceae bacterium]